MKCRLSASGHPHAVCIIRATGLTLTNTLTSHI